MFIDKAYLLSYFFDFFLFFCFFFSHHTDELYGLNTLALIAIAATKKTTLETLRRKNSINIICKHTDGKWKRSKDLNNLVEDRENKNDEQANY